MSIIQLNGVTLPAQTYRRNTREPFASFDDSFQKHYDFNTLFYDAFWVAAHKAICLVAPPLLNFEEVLTHGQFDVEGRGLWVVRIQRYKRFAIIWLQGCETPPRILRFHYRGFSATVAVPTDETNAFAGLKCGVIKSRDNDLIWLKDWAHYHVRIHGMNGLVVFDNASVKYGVEEVAEALAEVDGLKEVRVASAPYTFGVPGQVDTRFLQVALLNIARLRFLSRAAGVLSIDPDELVAPTSEGSIFETARRSMFGYVLFRGRWRHPWTGPATHRPRHFDHVFKTAQGEHISTKYCICPRGLFGFSHWDVHGAVRGTFKNLFVNDDLEYWHCRQITTNWEYLRTVPEEGLLLAQETRKVMDHAFPKEYREARSDMLPADSDRSVASGS